jgi:hypothetical protein
MKSQNNTTLSEHIPKSNIKIVGKGKIDTPNTQIYDHSLSWLGTGTSIFCYDSKKCFYEYERI